MIGHNMNKQNNNITDTTSCNNNNGSNAFYCDLCDTTFNKQASFDKHFLTSNQQHLDFKGIVKGFENEKEIPADTTTGFTCDKCSKNYKYKASFLTHAKTCGKGEHGGLESTTTTPLQVPSSATLPSTSPTNDTTLLLVNEIGTMMKTMSQIVTTLDLTIVTLNKMYNNNNNNNANSKV
jgi:uncharacterized C2H2 Zn-finger protein